MKSITWEMRTIDPANILPDPDNPRIHTEKGLAQLQDSLDRFGLAEPLVLNRVQGSGDHFVIIGGHARFHLLQAQGLPLQGMVPSRQLTQQEARELMVRLNKNVAGEFDFEKLEIILNRDMLLGIGFEDYELTLPHEDPGPITTGSTPRQTEWNPGYLIVQFTSRQQYDAMREVMAPAMLTEYEADPARFLEIISATKHPLTNG